MKRITPEDLPKSIRHVAFEFFHFSFYSRQLKDSKFLHGCSPAVRQAIGYSLLVHFRVLWEFFYEELGGDTCTVHKFREFLPEFKAAFPAEITKPAEARNLSKNLNKRLAHMSAVRWRERDRGMDFYERYFDGIDTQIAAFREALPPELQNSLIEEMHVFERRYEGRPPAQP
jgi:hypothetical protein